MNTQSNISKTMAERSVLMRMSAGFPGESRKDKRTTAEVQTEKKLGADSGRWVKNLWPEGALDAIKTKVGEARTYHNKVTLPWGCKNPDDGLEAIDGIGILPAALIAEYGDTMSRIRGEFAKLVEDTFLADPRKWVDWAVAAHNGTFDPSNYPGCKRDALTGAVCLDVEEFKRVMRKRFYLRTEPLPVPNASQFEAGIRQLLGADAETVDLRIADSEKEARRELMRRLTGPVQHMASKLAGKVCWCPACKGKPSKTEAFKDTLVGNVADIVQIADSLNLTGDTNITAFIQEMGALTKADAESLRDDKSKRDETAAKAEELFKRLAGYKI